MEIHPDLEIHFPNKTISTFSTGLLLLPIPIFFKLKNSLTNSCYVLCYRRRGHPSIGCLKKNKIGVSPVQRVTAVL